ncbi:hypothetical protein F5Y18DRAFT_442544 [Xylariaceae sp. FL1019]|nr:hypothetical protein F5Y18DRAFT_442544 [Xylariaceae sp. FL1019]
MSEVPLGSECWAVICGNQCAARQEPFRDYCKNHCSQKVELHAVYKHVQYLAEELKAMPDNESDDQWGIFPNYNAEYYKHLESCHRWLSICSWLRQIVGTWFYHNDQDAGHFIQIGKLDSERAGVEWKVWRYLDKAVLDRANVYTVAKRVMKLFEANPEAKFEDIMDIVETIHSMAIVPTGTPNSRWKPEPWDWGSEEPCSDDSMEHIIW